MHANKPNIIPANTSLSDISPPVIVNKKTFVLDQCFNDFVENGCTDVSFSPNSDHLR